GLSAGWPRLIPLLLSVVLVGGKYSPRGPWRDKKKFAVAGRCRFLTVRTNDIQNPHSGTISADEGMTSEPTTTKDLEAKAQREAQPSVDLGALSAAWHIGGPDFLPYRLLLVAKLLDRCTTRLLGSQF